MNPDLESYEDRWSRPTCERESSRAWWLVLTAAALILFAVVVSGCGTLVPQNQITGTIAGQPFKIRSPKNVSMQGLEINVVSVSPVLTNFAQIKIQNFSSTNDVSVIGASAQVERERWSGINSLVENIGKTAGTLGGQAAKTAVTGTP